MALALTSGAFLDGGDMPVRFTCDGRDVPPPLRWSGVPAATRSLALVVRDLDASGRDGSPWVHWVVYDLPAHAGGLGEGTAGPPGGRPGRNDWGRAGYGGPCPPTGRHRYRFELFALDVRLGGRLGDLDEPGAAALEAAMDGHVVASARLTGTYARS